MRVEIVSRTHCGASRHWAKLNEDPGVSQPSIFVLLASETPYAMVWRRHVPLTYASSTEVALSHTAVTAPFRHTRLAAQGTDQVVIRRAIPFDDTISIDCGLVAACKLVEKLDVCLPPH